MTLITKEQMAKELLPGLQALFDLQREKDAVLNSKEEFVSKEVYMRVVNDYEREIEALKDKNLVMMKRVALEARKDGVQRAAVFVEGMAEELGQSNLIHAVALALHNMEITE